LAKVTLPRTLTSVSPWVGVFGVVVGSVALAPAAFGVLERHASTGLFDAGLTRWLDEQPRFRDGSQPVAVGPVGDGLVTGDFLRHRLRLLATPANCRAALDGRA